MNNTPVGSNKEIKIDINTEKVEERISAFITSEGNKNIQIIKKDMLKGMFTSENLNKFQEMVVKFTEKMN